MALALGILPVALLLLGFPIFLVLLAAAVTALAGFMDMPLAALHQNLFGAIDAYTLLAVPFFIFAGELMGRGSVAGRLVGFVQAAVGPVRGSLALTTVGSSALFGAISGVSAATVATIGRAMLPALRRAGYPETFSAGMLTAVGAIDIVIPPSVAMIVYGVAAQQSVPRLYAAGILPGLLLALLLGAYVAWFARRHGIAGGGRFSWPALRAATLRGLGALGAPAIILGGIYGGVFSPTEAAAVACLYAIVVSRFFYRELAWRDILDAAGSTAVFTGQILLIVACAAAYSWLLTVHQVPAALAQWLGALQVAPWQLLLAINALLLLVGCVLDPISAILLLSPLLVPIATAAGIDPVHFGIIVTVNLSIGLFTPPFGVNIFIAQSVLRLPLAQIYRGIVPFLGVYLVALLLITYIPSISLAGVRWLVP
ncbi:TRAP transporter large permease [Pseudorhodoferax sp.]|uniref:TRAP transporter large permease n=1 Tax=Pseudorhodoferax sp. TaxID=1993553 RepID=UPI002DD66A6A|nr:TRAP transporter large permease [Pseudorhodoferax sp.]